MARKVTATEARAQLLTLLDEVSDGGEIEITRHGRSVARLVPTTASPTALRGRWSGTSCCSPPASGGRPPDRCIARHPCLLLVECRAAPLERPRRRHGGGGGRAGGGGDLLVRAGVADQARTDSDRGSRSLVAARARAGREDRRDHPRDRRHGASLPRSFPGDPADRLIYATAVERGWRLIMSDRRLRDHKRPRPVAVW